MSVSFVAWVVATILFLTSFTKPIHSLGIMVYPLSAIAVIVAFSLSRLTGQAAFYLNCCACFFINWSLRPSLSSCGSIASLSIQERFLHEHNFNTFVDKLPALQTMEDFLYQTLKMGFLLLTLSLISGYLYISDFFTQQLTYKTISISHGLDWFCWHLVCTHGFWNRGKLIVLLTQIAFAVSVLSYFGTKFFIEVLAI